MGELLVEGRERRQRKGKRWDNRLGRRGSAQNEEADGSLALPLYALYKISSGSHNYTVSI